MDYIILGSISGSRYFGKLLCEVGFDFVILVSVHRVLQISWCVYPYVYMKIYTYILGVLWGGRNQHRTMYTLFYRRSGIRSGAR